MLIKDSTGNPLSNAAVNSTMQPFGTAILSGTTNSTGYITFANVTVGQYSFNILKDGYVNSGTSINFTGQPVNATLTLSALNVAATNKNLLTLPIIIIVISVIIVVVVVLILLKRRRHDDTPPPLNPSSFSLSQYRES
jgi:hypothetical protein